MTSCSNWKDDEKFKAALRSVVSINLKHKEIFGLICPWPTKYIRPCWPWFVFSRPWSALISWIMNRIRISCFNIVSGIYYGVYYIVKVSFTALITAYCFQKFLFCTSSALDKMKIIFCSNHGNIIPNFQWRLSVGSRFLK